MKMAMIILAMLALTACGKNTETASVQGKDGINGVDGTNGNSGLSVLTGNVVPNDVDGKDGDSYFNTLNKNYYVKENGTWVLKANLNGAQGLKGDKGDKGDQGLTGATGAQGIQGLKGDKGDKGSTGATGAQGIKGDTGATGAKGDKGDAGANGKDGKDGKDGTNGKSCTVVDTAQGAKLECEDGTVADINDGKDGINGSNGTNGTNGKDGEDGVALTSVKVNKNTCTQVYQNIWVENINGEVFDVYYNPNCADNQGEYCDNVIPSYGVSGSVDDKYHRGSGTTCWADNVQIQGHRVTNTSKDFIIKVMDFNQ
jgi:hypothetical protein